MWPIGSTALVAVIRGTELTVANVGDSRGVLCDMDGKSHPLSYDHKPHEVIFLSCSEHQLRFIIINFAIYSAFLFARLFVNILSIKIRDVNETQLTRDLKKSRIAFLASEEHREAE